MSTDTDRRTKRLTLCKCGETATGARDREGRPACRAHAAPAELLPIRPDPPPKVTDGAIGGLRGMAGRDETGTTPEGADDWYYREPRNSPRANRQDSPIVVNDRLMWQQATPIHVKGAPFGDPRTHRTIARGITEAEAQRKAFEVAAGMWDEEIGRDDAAVAEGMGVSRSRVRRARKGRAHR